MMVIVLFGEKTEEVDEVLCLSSYCFSGLMCVGCFRDVGG